MKATQGDSGGSGGNGAIWKKIEGNDESEEGGFKVVVTLYSQILHMDIPRGHNGQEC